MQASAPFGLSRTMPPWCYQCYQGGLTRIQGDDEKFFYVRDFYRDAQDEPIRAWLCPACATFFSIPATIPKWDWGRRVVYGPIGVSWGPNAVWVPVRSDPLSFESDQPETVEDEPDICLGQPDIDMDDL